MLEILTILELFLIILENKMQILYVESKFTSIIFFMLSTFCKLEFFSVNPAQFIMPSKDLNFFFI